MGRRGFLKTLAGLGVSASTASALTQDAVADVIDDPRREVPRIRAFRHTNHQEVENGAKPEREPDVYKIPRSMWARVEAAHDARRQVERQLGGKYPVWVTTDDNGEKMVVVKQYDDGSLGSADIRALDEQVPASVKGVAGRQSKVGSPPFGNGDKAAGPRIGTQSRFTEEREIPVVIERPRISTSEKNEETSVIRTSGEGPISTNDININRHYCHDWEDIPAGACLQFGGNYNGGNIVGVGTSGFPAYRNGDHVVVSAGHNWAWPGTQYSAQHGWANGIIDTTNVNGSEYITETPDLDAQEVVDRNWDFGSYDPWDCSILGLDEGAGGVDHNIAADSNGNLADWPIYGTVATERLHDLEDNGTHDNEALHQQGATTGRQECEIDGVRDASFQTDLLGGRDVQQGDSGGPVVLVESDPRYPYSAAYPAGIISSRGPDDLRVLATTARMIEEEFDLYV